MGAALVRLIIRIRVLVVIATVALVGFAASGIQYLTFTTDYRAFFSRDNPQLKAFEAIQNTYAKYDNLMFVLAPANGHVFTREALSAIEWLTEQAWQVPYSSRVDSLSNFQHTYAEGNDLVVEDLYTDAVSLDEEQILKIKSVAMTEPLLRNRLVSDRGHVTGVNVTVQLPGRNPNREVPEVAGYGRQLASDFRERYPAIDIHLTGVVMMNVSFPEASQHDMRTFMPVMFIVVIVTLMLMTRSVAGTLGTVLVIAFSTLSAIGLAGWMGIKLTGPSAASPIIILTLAVADCVHLLTNFVQAMHRGVSKVDAMQESMRVNLQPLFITSLTTAIGFLSMNLSDVPPFRDLGNIIATGVALAFVFSITFLPAFMSIMPVHVRRQPSHGDRVMRWFAEFVVSRHRQLLRWLGPMLLALIAFIPANEFNDEFVKYFDKTIEFRRATDFTTENLTGIYTIQLSLDSGGSNEISKPEFLAAVNEFTEWFRQQPEVIHVNSITDTFKRLNKSLHNDDEAWYRVPERRDLAAQYLLLYEMSLPYGLDLNDQVNIDKSATRFVVTTHSLSTKDTLALEARARSWLKQNAPESMHSARGSSPNIMFAHITKRNIRSMLVGTTLALIAISLILIVALRSLKFGLISLVPNLTPAALAFGLWGILVGQVGLSISIVTAMTLGIIVDDTVHFLSKYTRARREDNMDAADAVRYAFTTVGMALLVTSVVLIAGFLVLSQSAFQVNSGMGLLTAITIAFALIADFLFLPPLLMAMDRWKMARSGTPAPAVAGESVPVIKKNIPL